MEQKIKVGDRVRVVKEWHVFHPSRRDGQPATVVSANGLPPFPYTVKFEDPDLGGNILVHSVELLAPETTPKEKNGIKVGDRVRIVKAYPNIHNNELAEVVDPSYGVFSSKRVRVKLQSGELWNCRKVELVKVKHPVIVITTDGKTTTATMREGKKVLKTAEARCNADDAFDFAEGARIAFERLQGRDPFPVEKKPKYFNGKLVCVESPYTWWTVGKVYEVVDGVITADDGDRYPAFGSPYRDAEDAAHPGCNGEPGDLRHNPLNAFIPFVED